MSPASLPRLPDGFRFGASTAAYQIEGAATEGGRGPSVWDTFCDQPGRIADGSSGAVACDHYHRYPEDVALMRELGLGGYRLSVAWPRIQPAGSGRGNPEGLAFYDRLVDSLLEAGVRPMVTLFHWDLPQALEDAGGWPVRDTAYRFAEYAAAMGAALGDRVRRWSTICEPWCVSMLGYASGIHAPGRSEPGAAVAAAHHLLVAHGLAVDALRAGVALPPEVAITLNPYPVVVAGDMEADVDTARRIDGVANRLWYDALLLGRYPDDVLEDFSTVSDMAHILDGDLTLISRPIDAIGVNYYRRHHARFAGRASVGPPTSTWPGSPDVELVDPGVATTASGWAIEPDGLLETLLRLTREYDPPPIYVHESGAAFDDQADAGGYVNDQDRLAYLRDHVRVGREALAAGVDLRGFFVWSFLDNFEWAEGYAKRFGIVRVDFDTQRRTPKASAEWYSRLARTGELS
jgi:beta-glucosidase